LVTRACVNEDILIRPLALTVTTKSFVNISTPKNKKTSRIL
jgi:hypothetical protein